MSRGANLAAPADKLPPPRPRVHFGPLELSPRVRFNLLTSERAGGRASCGGPTREVR